MAGRFMNRATDKVPSLPVEIIFRILLFLSPHELIHLQRVSKQFRAIIDDRTFWKTLYADAHLPRPPGPFSWQSTEFLQRTLVRSARLAQHWTSEPINCTFKCSLSLGLYVHYKWLCGRWLVVHRRRTRGLALHDIDTGSEQTLCQWDNQRVSWDATCCRVSTRGQLLYVGLYSENAHNIELLEFQVDDDSGHLSGPITYDSRLSSPGGTAIFPLVHSGATPFVLISAGTRKVLAGALIFDARNHTFYKFSKTETERSPCVYKEIVLTLTHVIVIRGHTSYPKGQLIQAYAIPDDNQPHELRLSHETATRDELLSWFLLRNSVVDPVTGSTSLRFLNCHLGQRFVCTDFTLPANSPGDTLPISIDTHAVLAMDNIQFNTDNKFIQASPDGFARGFCDVISVLMESCVCKFTIDATGERCVGVVGDLCLARRLDYGRWVTLFDGVRGRISYHKNVGVENVVVVADFE